MKKILSLFPLAQKIILIISSILLVLALSITVVMRYFLNSDIFGLEELIIIPGLWVYFLGAGYATREKNFHIQADLISSYVTNENILKTVKIIISVVTLMTSAIMTFWSFKFLKTTIMIGSVTPSLKIPLYVSYSSIFVGFFIMTIYFFYHSINDIIFMIKDDNEKGSGEPRL